MDINKHIVDLRIRKIASDNSDKFRNENDENKKLSKAFVCLSAASYLDIEPEEAFGLITDGGNDAGIDAVYIGDVIDYHFQVVVFQSKYKFNLEHDSNFPANEIQRVIGSVGAIFDPCKAVEMNEDLKSQVYEIRSLIADGCIPCVRCVFTNNGLKWNNDGENHIKNSGFPETRVQFEHFNHEDIVNSLLSKKGIDETIRLSGKSISEGFNFKRVLVGKMNVAELAKLFEKHGDGLLNRNIRKYLGLNKNSVNSAIRETLIGNKRDNFYFYNNGITMICDKFSTNELQESDRSVRVENLQIINGGQTCRTILNTVRENPQIDYSDTCVLVRLYELSDKEGNDSLITEVTIATNSQNPVDLRDLRANDNLQKKLEAAVSELGFHYKRKKGNNSFPSSKTIHSSVAAEAVYSVWKRKPIQAKFKKRELFGTYYKDVFDNVNGAQLILAVLIYRHCDAQRKNPLLINDYPHIPYSNYFMAMFTGQLLLNELNLQMEQLTHLTFTAAKDYFETEKERLFNKANDKLVEALTKLYPDGYDKIDKRRLAATFRRGDLLEIL